MPVYEAPGDPDDGVGENDAGGDYDGPRQSYNFAPGYRGVVYRADVPDWGRRASISTPVSRLQYAQGYAKLPRALQGASKTSALTCGFKPGFVSFFIMLTPGTWRSPSTQHFEKSSS
ncbi:hypothetical protein NUW58_g9365 [Xylaria curta]|uniref:Uncharacterized protein n=1 Tax=Xylaria curta TaxID=42375 RepID=A0ACC1MX60_9PEZI|nr:hypothetical protein NUW58_g9365 [Xylaria curta]